MLLLSKMILRWLIITAVVVFVAYICINKTQDFAYETNIPNTIASRTFNTDSHYEGRPRGANNLYGYDNATVRMPSIFNETMEECKRTCYDGVTYVAPIDYLNDHLPVPVEIGWCLNECMVKSSAHLFDTI